MRRQLTLFIVLAIAILESQFVHAEIEHFITRRGDKLFAGDEEFRFISFNIPNLHLVEDDLSPGRETAWGWPNEFEITDALESVDQMGGTVVRTYVLSVRKDGSDMGDQVYVKAPGEFNEQAFQVLDLALKLANEKGIRLIVPLVDQWWWMGGRQEYAAFRGKHADDFWTDEQIIRDFEETIRYVLNRKNTLTGVAYKDDPTIFGWETGNEIKPPHEWTKRIAAFIKSIDDKHVVIDGNSLQGVSQEQVDDPNIDVITTHHYPQPLGNFIKPIREAWQMCKGKKPYFVGEFGFIPADEVKEVLDLVVDEGMSGALIWSLRYHHRDGGFYWHSEPLGAGIFKAYHWPGFASGDAYEEIETLKHIRDAAFAIRGLDVPPIPKPQPPTLLPISDPSAISWQGSVGAAQYDVLRS
jgi:mannan endo-1,4-beta-mannosidase